MQDPPNRAPRGTKMSKRRRLLFLGLAACLTLLIVVILGEGLLRIYVAARGWTPNCYSAANTLYIPHPERGADLRPNFRLRSATFETSVNSLGFRGPEITVDKPDDVQRVAILGGSSAFGYLVNDGEEAARLLSAELQRRGHAVEVINSGVPGYNLFHTIGRYEERVAPLRPDIVVLYLGYNDLPYVVSEDPDAPGHRQRALPGTWERLMGRSVLHGFVTYRLLHYARPVDPLPEKPAERTAVGEQQFRSNLETLGRVIEESGAAMVVCSQAMSMHPQAEQGLLPMQDQPGRAQQLIELGQWTRDALESFAAEQNAEFVDVYNEIAPTNENLGDFVHLTRTGERQLAKLLADRIEPLLKQSPLSPSGGEG